MAYFLEPQFQWHRGIGPHEVDGDGRTVLAQAHVNRAWPGAIRGQLNFGRGRRQLREVDQCRRRLGRLNGLRLRDDLLRYWRLTGFNRHIDGWPCGSRIGLCPVLQVCFRFSAHVGDRLVRDREAPGRIDRRCIVNYLSIGFCAVVTCVSCRLGGDRLVGDRLGWCDKVGYRYAVALR